MADKELLKLYETLKEKGFTPEEEKRILCEVNFKGIHEIKEHPSLENLTLKEIGHLLVKHNGIYQLNDLNLLQGFPSPRPTEYQALQTIDDLLERDKQREKDGFPKKIRLGKIAKPAKGKKGKIVIVPVTTEDKFVHDDRFGLHGLGQGEGGSGEGEEGDVIGEVPVYGEGGEGEGEGAGTGEGGEHGIESRAYELGKILTEKFELPNLQDKGKKKVFKQYSYELTDKNRGHGQLLDKKATLKKILETNITLGNVPDKKNIDTTKFLVHPRDKIYRILSREEEYESEAIVFFLRDYSGSMSGKPTEAVVMKDLFIYAWLLYQYERQVIPRFIVHDTEAKEVPDFHTYYNLSIAGGTDVHTAFGLVNKIVEKENLARDYNIYVFYGGDGEDWFDGKETIAEIKKILSYTNRMGITLTEHQYAGISKVGYYIKNSGLLEEKSDLIRLDSMKVEEATEERIIEGIKKIIS